MDNAQTCFERAALDRTRADEAETEHQREIHLRSALKWQEMGETCAHFERQRKKREEEVALKAAERAAEKAREERETLAEKSAAESAGHLTYFTGKPCKRGHVEARWTINGTCIQCQNENRVATRIPA